MMSVYKKCSIRKVNPSGKGFTLIELLIVMAVMGLALALVGPNLMASYQKAQAKSEQQEFEELLQKLSYQAFLNERSISIQLNLQRVTYFYSDEPIRNVTVDYQFVEFPRQSIELSSAGFPEAWDYSVVIGDVLIRPSLEYLQP